jgi:hypothetical protein
VSDYSYEAKHLLKALISSLRTLIARDPEQEVQGIAIPEIEATFAAVKAAKPDLATPELFSADHIGSGDGIRAADLLVAVERLDAAVGDPPPPPAAVPKFSFPPPQGCP